MYTAGHWGSEHGCAVKLPSLRSGSRRGCAHPTQNGRRGMNGGVRTSRRAASLVLLITILGPACSPESRLDGTPVATFEPSGQAPFGFGAVFNEPLRIGREARLLLSMGGPYRPSAMATSRIEVSNGVQVIEGETLRRARPSGRSGLWSIRLKVLRPGRSWIRGTVTIDTGAGYTDEGEFLLTLDAGNDTVMVAPSTLVRAETVRGGQRFRYAGKALVPIRKPERFTEEDIRARGTRARVKVATPGKCPECTDRAATTLEYLVVVDEHGAAIAANLRAQGVPEPAAERAARIALREWKFAPARLDGKAVADWAYVQVSVEP